MTAMLKSHHVHLTVLSRSLEEDITPKKTWERLNRNLSKEGLGAELMRMNLRKNARKIKDFRYCIIDGGDIQKPETKQMEGLGSVRDGSKKTKDKKPVIGKGYYWLNAVLADDEEILPVYGDIYSLEHEAKDHVSEHTKIYEITDEEYHLANILRIREEWNDSRPVVAPGFADHGITTVPCFFEYLECFFGLFNG